MSQHRTLFSVCSVPVEWVYPLRTAVLLEGRPDSCRFRGDDDASTLHLAVYQNERIVAVASVCREALSGSVSDAEWRLRGIAVEEGLRGYGLGRLLVKLCLDHVQKEGGRLAWCTARESARKFYELLDFVDDVLDPLNSRQEAHYAGKILETGTGADRQLKIYQDTGNLVDVVDYIQSQFLQGA